MNSRKKKKKKKKKKGEGEEEEEEEEVLFINAFKFEQYSEPKFNAEHKRPIYFTYSRHKIRGTDHSSPNNNGYTYRNLDGGIGGEDDSAWTTYENISSFTAKLVIASMMTRTELARYALQYVIFLFLLTVRRLFTFKTCGANGLNGKKCNIGYSKCAPTFNDTSSRIHCLVMTGQVRQVAWVAFVNPTLTEEKDEIVKDAFYERLDRVHQQIPKHDIIIILGDMNAKIGKTSVVSNVAHGSPTKIYTYKHGYHLMALQLIKLITSWRIKFNINKFEDSTIADEYRRTITDNIHKQNIQEMNIEQKWSFIKQNIHSSASEIIQTTQNKNRNTWFDRECKEMIDKRNELRLVMLQKKTRAATDKYKEGRRNAKNICKMKKKMFEENLLYDLDEKFGKNESRKFFESVRRQKKGFQPRTMICKNKDGNLITGELQVLKVWTEYFNDLLSSGGQEDINVNVSYFGPDPYMPVPTNTMVYDAIRKMKNNRAPGKIRLMQS
ncbi:hypothetical protein ANN_11291 [Periplaneta americana]|uniref:Craniofacial development protein 2-like n=1 Tax=Periplaneta americana TaxID=6978 RepID=A0ABQ8T608_PERAM|nr:hypothetical protein ANN_11291 [Periplaneta americana]